jgi:hypothetical protein
MELKGVATNLTVLHIGLFRDGRIYQNGNGLPAMGAL